MAIRPIRIRQETALKTCSIESPGLIEHAELLRQGERTSVDLVTAAFDRIDAIDPDLNSFKILRREAALAEAARADDELRSGRVDARLRPLLGVPIAIKDETDVEGLPTAFGCGGTFPPATADAESVRRLKAAGAVIVGKTNACELGQWPYTEGPAFGVTRNPWNLDHSPGGSSGGSSAAVAAGLVPAALGADGGGSVRIPAAWTNLVGIKPQRGRIPTEPVIDPFNGITVLGPLARTVGDAALMLDVTAGTGTQMQDATQADPGRLRIAVSTRPPFTFFRTPVDTETEARARAVGEQLASLGHDVVEVDPTYGPLIVNWAVRASVGLVDASARQPSETRYDAKTAANLKTGRRVRASGLLRPIRAIEPRLVRRVGRIFDDVDVVLTPTTALPPARIGDFADWNLSQTERHAIAACPFTWTWNATGWPGVNVPAGFTAAGLPVGAQLLGPASSEPLLLSLAAQLESEQRWQDHWPAAGSQT